MAPDAGTPPPDHLTTFWDLSLDLLCITDVAEGRFVFLNRAWEAVLGFTPEELTSRPFLDFVHPDDVGRTAELRDRLGPERRQVVEFENRYCHKEGGWRWLRWNAVVGPDGLVFALATDVTRRKRVEMFLRLYSEVAEAANESEELEPALARTVEVVCDALGFPIGHAYLVEDHRLVSTPLWHLHDPQGAAAFRAATESIAFELDHGAVGRAAATGKPVWVEDVLTEEFFLRRQVARDAGIRSAVLVPVRSGKEVAAVLEFLTDEPLEATAEMGEVLENVGIQLGQVIERNAAVRAREEGLDIERRYLSMVSHELRSPLAAIKGFGDVLALRWREFDPADVDEFLDRMRRNVARLEHHVTTFLDTARLRSEGITPRLEDFDVGVLVRRAVTSLGDLGGAVTVDVREGTTAMGDVHFVDQILVNLLSNAAKYGRPPVSVTATTPRPRRVEIRVHDEGDGVPEEFRPHLFKRFSRADRSEESAGTGLGLSIGRDLARAMGADLVHEPAPTGSTFVLRLAAPD